MTIWITRHGESIDNRLGRLGGDSALTDRGEAYARWLGQNMAVDRLWTSNLVRARQTGRFVKKHTSEHQIFNALNELNAGRCEHLTYAEIKRDLPQIAAARSKDKFNFLYPGIGGESYAMVSERLKDLVGHLRTLQGDTLIICHQAVARMLLAALRNKDPAEYTSLPIPLHECIKVEI